MLNKTKTKLFILLQKKLKFTFTNCMSFVFTQKPPEPADSVKNYLGLNYFSIFVYDNVFYMIA